MDLSIKYATINDAGLIADLSRKTFYETFAVDNSKENIDKFLREQFTKGKLMLEVGIPGNIFLLAYMGNEIAGYVKLREGNGPKILRNASALEIARLYAVAHLIGKGVGTFLMQTSIDVAKARNKQVVWLGVWEKNQRAINFYKKWGFEKFGEQDFLLGNDMQCDWMMKKQL